MIGKTKVDGPSSLSHRKPFMGNLLTKTPAIRLLLEGVSDLSTKWESKKFFSLGRTYKIVGIIETSSPMPSLCRLIQN